MFDSKAICKQLIKDYCSNCSFAGIHFIADNSKHWSESSYTPHCWAQASSTIRGKLPTIQRWSHMLLWAVLVALSWYGSALLIISAWEAFILSPISFGVETVYIDWDTKMPTVAICEYNNDLKIYNVSDTIWTPQHLPDLEDALREIAYYRGVSRVLLGNCYLHSKPDANCPLSNYSYYAKLVRSGCNRILANCSYNNQEFACCEHFLPIETDIGPCFIINSIQTNEQKPYPMVKNIKNPRGTIKFVVRLTSTIYTLGDDEVPTITTSYSSTLKIQLGNSYRRTLSVRNIENDILITETTTEQRACRFHDENEGGLYPYYSYSACTVLCRKEAQLKYCKCNDHFMLNTTDANRCNISGMACLNTLSKTLTTLKPSWAQRPGLTCNCLPSCDETEITVISDLSSTLKGKANKQRAPVEIVLAYLPTERFKRNVVRSRLDLVVSVGGTTGLFVGASILSFVELIFFFTVRLFNNIWMNRHRNKYNNEQNVGLNNYLNTEEIEHVKLRRLKNVNKDNITKNLDRGIKIKQPHSMWPYIE